MPAKGWSETCWGQCWETQPRLVEGTQLFEPSQQYARLPVMRSWKQEPELEIEPKHSDVGYGCFSCQVTRLRLGFLYKQSYHLSTTEVSLFFPVSTCLMFIFFVLLHWLQPQVKLNRQTLSPVLNLLVLLYLCVLNDGSDFCEAGIGNCNQVNRSHIGLGLIQLHGDSVQAETNIGKKLQIFWSSFETNSSMYYCCNSCEL